MVSILLVMDPRVCTTILQLVPEHGSLELQQYILVAEIYHVLKSFIQIDALSASFCQDCVQNLVAHISALVRYT